MPPFGATPQVQPPTASLKTLDTAGPAWLGGRADSRDLSHGPYQYSAGLGSEVEVRTRFFGGLAAERNPLGGQASTSSEEPAASRIIWATSSGRETESAWAAPGTSTVLRAPARSAMNACAPAGILRSSSP